MARDRPGPDRDRLVAAHLMGVADLAGGQLKIA